MTPKWHLLRIDRKDQRAWRLAECDDFSVYLADQSGDGINGVSIGDPDSAQDGPLKVLAPDRIILEPSDTHDYLIAMIPVLCERTGEKAQVIVRETLARWLAMELEIPIWHLKPETT